MYIEQSNGLPLVIRLKLLSPLKLQQLALHCHILRVFSQAAVTNPISYSCMLFKAYLKQYELKN